MPWSAQTSFRPRATRFEGIAEVAGWRLKRYTITYGDPPIEWPVFEEGWSLVERALPSPALTDDRPGVGFVIAHQGRTASYLVLGWWDRENELPLRVFVRDRDGEDTWRPARGGESVCVWDLAVIWHEREAYVRTMLGGERGDVEAYLSEWLTVEPA